MGERTGDERISRLWSSRSRDGTLPEWCNEAAYGHWAQTGDPIPTWEEAYERLVAEGRLSRVAHPTQEHSERKFAKPRLKPLIGADIKPKVSRKIEA